MSKETMVRRDALRKLAVLSAAALPAAWLVACSKKPNCDDTAGLTAEDLTMRKNAEYVPQALQVAKKCDGCVQWVPPAPDQCGGCKVIKGPIAAEGTCKLFVAKPA